MSATPQATAILRRVPVHMSHNVTVLDAAGRAATVFLGPGQQGVVSPRPYATNHQETVAWQAYADATGTLEREAFLSLCGEPKTRDRIQHMLQKSKPLRN